VTTSAPTPGAEATAPRSLTVMAEAPDVAMDWAVLVSEVAHAFDVEPCVVTPEAGTEGAWAADALLAAASAVPGPVLVLPPRLRRRASRHREPVGGGPPVGGAGALRRVLVPSDASDEVASATRPLVARLQGAGIVSTILHVLTEDNRPRMWEGSGHHADEWFEEMRRRHAVGPDVLRVVTGDPREVLETYVAGTDMVVALWHHEPAGSRAPLLHEVLAASLDVPLLLVPLAWVEANGLATRAGTVPPPSADR